MNRFHAIPILSLSLLLCACGKSQSASGQQSDVLNACELLTAEDIQAVTGQAMKPGKLKHGTTCYFESMETQGPVDRPKYTWWLQRLHHAYPLEQEVQQYLDGMREGLGEDAKTLVSKPVEGVGDRAFWQSYYNVNILVVFRSAGGKATDFISVQPDFEGEEQALEQAKALALRALVRL